MVTALLVLALGSAPDGGVVVEGRLRSGTPTQGACTMERLTATTPAVRWAWRSACGLDWVQQHAWSSGALALGNYDFNPVLLFDEARAVSVGVKDVPPFAAEAVQRVRQRLVKTLPPGVFEVAVDPRDQSLLVMKDQQLLRGRRDAQVFEPVFPSTRPWSADARALAWDRSPAVKNPWLVTDATQGKEYLVRLIGPADTSRVLVRRPRPTSELTRTRLAAMLLPGAALPVVSVLLNDGRHSLFVPTPDGADLVEGTFDRVPLVGPPPPPAGASTKPSGLPRQCSETVLEHVGEARAEPLLFERGGAAFLAYGVQTTRSRLRFGLVPRRGLTPDDDTYACEWIEDARAVTPAFVIAEVLPDGSTRERLHLDLQQPVAQLVVDHGPSQLVAMLKGADLTVLSLDPSVLAR